MKYRYKKCPFDSWIKQNIVDCKICKRQAKNRYDEIQVFNRLDWSNLCVTKIGLICEKCIEQKEKENEDPDWALGVYV